MHGDNHFVTILVRILALPAYIYGGLVRRKRGVWALESEAARAAFRSEAADMEKRDVLLGGAVAGGIFMSFVFAMCSTVLVFVMRGSVVLVPVEIVGVASSSFNMAGSIALLVRYGFHQVDYRLWNAAGRPLGWSVDPRSRLRAVDGWVALVAFLVLAWFSAGAIGLLPSSLG